MTLEELRASGNERIKNPDHSNPIVPLKPWQDFPLRFTVEYPVTDFPLEVGFWAEKLGLHFLSLDSEYAICTDTTNSFTFSFQSSEKTYDLAAIKIQWFTDDLNEAISFLNERGVSYQLHTKSAVQRFVRFHSPAGITVEIWSGDESSRE